MLDSGQQTARVDRLSDKIIRTRGKPILALIFIDKSSNQNNRYVRAGRTALDAAADFKAVHFRHHHI